jgi:hypothetical protein
LEEAPLALLLPATATESENSGACHLFMHAPLLLLSHQCFGLFLIPAFFFPVSLFSRLFAPLPLPFSKNLG